MTVGHIGDLRERVLWQQPVRSIDNLRDPTNSWSGGITLYARVMPVKASEVGTAERNEADAQYEVTIRWRAGVSNRDRFVWRGRYLGVAGMKNPDERRRFLVLTCNDQDADAGHT